MSKQRYQNLKAFLDATGQTQEEFAKLVGIQQSQVSKIVNGRQRPSLTLALKIAELAQVPVASLLPSQEVA